MDWRNNLSKADQEVLDSLLAKIGKYRKVYETADNPQLVQMWLILLEIAKSSSASVATGGNPQNPELKLVQKLLKPRRTEIMDTLENY